MEVRGSFTAGTTANASAQWNLPTGYTIDTSKMSTSATYQVVGMAGGSGSGSSAPRELYYDGTTGSLYCDTAQPAATINKCNANNWTTGDNVTYNFTVPITQWSGSVTGFNAGQIANSWSGYHAQTCAMSETNGAYTDPTGDATCSLVERTNNNFGTVASKTDGTGPTSGITFTPSRAGTYQVCARGTFIVSTGTGTIVDFRLWDGTTTIMERQIVPTTSGRITPIDICGAYKTSSTSSTTITLQTKSDSGGTVTFQTGATNAATIEWSIFQIDQQIPAPLVINSVITPNQAVTEIVGATVTSAGVVTETTGDWISGNCSKASSVYTCTLNSNIFSAAPSCTVSALASGGADAVVDTVSASQVIVRTFNSLIAATDEAFHLICVGQH